jgi:hypothetical protein
VAGGGGGTRLTRREGCCAFGKFFVPEVAGEVNSRRAFSKTKTVSSGGGPKRSEELRRLEILLGEKDLDSKTINPAIVTGDTSSERQLL